MFASLKGIVSKLDNGKVISDVNGVGYLLNCSVRTVSAIKFNELNFLFVETIVKEDSISLYGFIDNLEQSWFNILTTVKGVGYRIALQILGDIEIKSLENAIRLQDKSIFKKVSGVGNKIAERILLELKDKDLPYSDNNILNNVIEHNINDSNYEDALMALVALGYQKYEAIKKLNYVVENNDTNLSSRDLIKLALRELSK